MTVGMSRGWGKDEARASQSGGPHAIVIKKICDLTHYGFTIPGWDAGRNIFGPAVGPPGLAGGDHGFAFQTVDGEWFIVKPDMEVV